MAPAGWHRPADVVAELHQRGWVTRALPAV
jgi:lambda repressor-like predicted transcriptional regulator